MLDTGGSSSTTNSLVNQQQNLTGFYHNNLHSQQIASSASTSSSQQLQAFTTIDQTQFQQAGAVKVEEQNHFNNNLQQVAKVEAPIPHTKNNHQSEPVNQQQLNNNMHLRNKPNDVSHQKSAPRNHEYLEQQQQQRPSPVQGTTAPDTNHLNSGDSVKQNSITKTTAELKVEPTPAVKQPSLMETFDLSETGMLNLENLNLKQVFIPLSKMKVSAEEEQQVMATLEDFNAAGDLFSKMKDDEKRAPMKRKVPFDEDAIETFNKPKLRRIEKKLAPVLKAMSNEELMKTNTYQRFISFMDQIFEQLDDTEVISMEENDENIECIPSSLLANISAEAAKLKARASIYAIPEDKLTLLINYAMRSLHAAKNLSAGPDLSEDLVAEDCLEKILNAIEAALLICNIYTSKDTKFLQEDNIDTIIKFVQFQLRETIFPSYDPVYTIETKKKSEKAQNKKKQSNQQKGITTLYTKTVELTKLFVRLFNKFHFVDTIIIHASSLGVEPFFVDNIETLQFVCLDLVTSVRSFELLVVHLSNFLFILF